MGRLDDNETVEVTVTDLRRRQAPHDLHSLATSIAALVREGRHTAETRAAAHERGCLAEDLVDLTRAL